tara:strand:+ start:3484 stop:3774 length:291 start_codon:yes stop_codon:yes gene_type:complete
MGVFHTRWGGKGGHHVLLDRMPAVVRETASLAQEVGADEPYRTFTDLPYSANVESVNMTLLGLLGPNTYFGVSTEVTDLIADELGRHFFNYLFKGS